MPPERWKACKKGMVVFTAEMSQEEKKKILKEDFDIDTEAEREIGEELEQMCNLSEAIEEKGVEKGVEKGEGLFAALAERLINDNRMDDLKKVTVDKVSREKLYKEYGLKTVG